MRLPDKVAIVTGAAGGIGAAIAERFVAEGATVIAADVAIPEKTLVQSETPRLLKHALDLTDPDSVTRLVSDVRAEFPRIHVLVNNAGIGRNLPFLETPIDVFDRILAVNLRGTFLMSQAVTKEMAAAGGGAIVNLASVSAHRGNLGRAAYGASKGGIVTLSEVMAVELARYKIRVNAISPGPIETSLVTSMHSAAERIAWTAHVPLRRYGSVGEVAAAAVYLASDEASYITGHVLAVDGGFLAAGLASVP